MCIYVDRKCAIMCTNDPKCCEKMRYMTTSIGPGLPLFGKLKIAPRENVVYETYKSIEIANTLVLHEK